MKGWEIATLQVHNVHQRTVVGVPSTEIITFRKGEGVRLRPIRIGQFISPMPPHGKLPQPATYITIKKRVWLCEEIFRNLENQ